MMTHILCHLTIDRSLMVWLLERKIRNLKEKCKYRPLLMPNVSPPWVFEVTGWNSYIMYLILSCLRWISPIFDVCLRFPARFFQILTFFVHNSPLMPSVHFQCLTTYKSATIHNKINPANLFLRNLVLFPTIPVSFFYDQKQKSSIGRLWRTIDKWRSKRNQAGGGILGRFL